MKLLFCRRGVLVVVEDEGGGSRGDLYLLFGLEGKAGRFWSIFAILVIVFGFWQFGGLLSSRSIVEMLTLRL